MHDIRWIRDNPDAFDAALARRDLAPLSAGLIALDEQNRGVQTEVQTLQARRNEVSKQIGQLKKAGQDASAVMAEVDQIKTRLAALEEQQKTLGDDLGARLAAIPNMLAEDVPNGPDESANVQVRRHGDPPRLNDVKDHVDLGTRIGGVDFEAAARLSGARFVVLRGALARLERALGQYFLNTQTEEFGFTEVAPPLLVHGSALFGTGQLPKFEEDQFKANTGHYFIPTAEVPLTNLVADQILDAADLPLRFTALTQCFRSEAGSAGRDVRGMIRQHQFNKVEMVAITHPDASAQEHERMTECAQTLLERLGLAYRTVLLCSGDTGFSAAKTYDLEVWLPGQGTYREISSCSNCRDFQARRMKARFRETGDKRTQFVHTLNGSGLAVGRAFIAVLENYQQPDGSIVIPEVLRPYMANQEVIHAPRS